MKHSIIFSLLFFTAVFSSCNKDDEPVNDKEVENKTSNIRELGIVAKENADAEAIFDDIYEEVSKNDEAKSSSPGLKNSMEESVTITVENLNESGMFPRRVTIDYGNSHTNWRQVTKSGKIIATYSGRYRDSGTVISVALENYTRNGASIAGSKTITNKGINSKGNQVFHISVKDATITDSTGTGTWDLEREREWIAGSETMLNWLDDVYSITGTASGTTVNANQYAITATEPLIFPISCGTVTKGVLNYSVNIEAQTYTASIDYGEGECDRTAKATIFGQEITIYQY